MKESLHIKTLRKIRRNIEIHPIYQISMYGCIKREVIQTCFPPVFYMIPIGRLLLCVNITAEFSLWFISVQPYIQEIVAATQETAKRTGAEIKCKSYCQMIFRLNFTKF